MKPHASCIQFIIYQVHDKYEKKYTHDDRSDINRLYDLSKYNKVYNGNISKIAICKERKL